MRISKSDVPVRFAAPGAVARQQAGFGTAKGYGAIGAEYFSLGKGTDITPLLQGLEHDLCQCPHWGYVLSGELTASYADGSSESVRAGDLFYWPPGHTIRSEQDSEFILFSPEHEHGQVMDHIQSQLT